MQPDTPVAGRRGGAIGERSRFGPALPDTVGFSVEETLTSHLAMCCRLFEADLRARQRQ